MSKPFQPDTTHIHRYTNRETGVMVEGAYLKRTELFALVGWRVFTPQFGWGKWYKIHGNQKKDLGVLRLVRDTPPVAQCELTLEEVARARR